MTGTAQSVMRPFLTVTSAMTMEHVASAQKATQYLTTEPTALRTLQTALTKSTQRPPSGEKQTLLTTLSGLNGKTTSALSVMLASTGLTTKMRLEVVSVSAQTLTRSAITVMLKEFAQSVDASGWSGTVLVLTRSRTAMLTRKTNLENLKLIWMETITVIATPDSSGTQFLPSVFHAELTNVTSASSMMAL